MSIAARARAPIRVFPRRLTPWVGAAQAGVGLVFGGGGDGLMGRVARATLDGGGRVTGIIPKFLVKREHVVAGAQDLVVVDTMHERKQLMFERADAFIALPGGVGTLEESSSNSPGCNCSATESRCFSLISPASGDRC